MVRSTNHPLLNFYNFCKYISSCVFFFTFFDIVKFTIGFPTNCWQILNWPISIKFLFPLFQFYYLPYVIFGWQKKTILLHKSDVRGSFLKKEQVGYFKTKCCDDIFLQPPKRFASWLKFSPLGFCLLVVNHSSCRDWITDKYWLTFGFE